MRKLLLAFATIAGLAAVASADPLPAAPGNTAAASESWDAAQIEAADRAPPTYVQAGTVVGLTSSYLTFGASAEVGRRITPRLWLHTTFTRAPLDKLLARGHGELTQATVGLDYVLCSPNGIYCGFAGADVGARSIQYSGMDVELFCDGPCGPGDPIEDHRVSPIAAARAGWDMGGKHVRFRTAVEATLTPHGSVGVLITDSLVYRF